MILSRRAALLGAGTLLLAPRARAQAPDVMYSDGGNVEYIDEARAEWFENLKRPDIVEAVKNGDLSEATVTSCCTAADGYPIVIDEDAYPPHVGQEANGTAHVIDPSAKTIILPSGTKKWRPAITGSLTFKFAANKVVREIDGNPTKTAWAFLHVGYASEVNHGEINIIYCIVPLPPGF